MGDEMRKALEADGEKLRQLTGEDHGPWTIAQCITWHRFVRHDRAGDYLRLGWCPSLCDRSPALDGTPHGQYSVLMSWICQCRPVEPRHAPEHDRGR
jgi:hypothetical protein